MFYTFRQNNSGGSFVFDPVSGISTTVIVEADDLEEAVYRAQRIGLYFNGVDDGSDCGCCGDRWYEPFYDDGSVEPEVYGRVVHKDEPFNEQGLNIRWVDGPQGYIHYKDNSFVPFDI